MFVAHPHPFFEEMGQVRRAKIDRSRNIIKGNIGVMMVLLNVIERLLHHILPGGGKRGNGGNQFRQTAQSPGTHFSSVYPSRLTKAKLGHP